jgi:hypothetical protein
MLNQYEMAERRFGPIGVARVYGVGPVAEGPDGTAARRRVGPSGFPVFTGVSSGATVMGQITGRHRVRAGGRAERARDKWIGRSVRGESRRPILGTSRYSPCPVFPPKKVTVRPVDRDRYGRTVAEVLLPDGRSLGREMVRRGLAW